MIKKIEKKNLINDCNFDSRFPAAYHDMIDKIAFKKNQVTSTIVKLGTRVTTDDATRDACVFPITQTTFK